MKKMNIIFKNSVFLIWNYFQFCLEMENGLVKHSWTFSRDYERLIFRIPGNGYKVNFISRYVLYHYITLEYIY